MSDGSAATKSHRKGRTYATIVYKPKTSRVVPVGTGKGRETIDRFREEKPGVYQRLRIENDCCDTSEIHIGAVGEWLLKDEFEPFREFEDIDKAESFLDGWCKTANKSRLDSIKAFVNTIRKHKHRLPPFVENRLTNASAAGINRIIEIIKNGAGGFRNLEAISDLIYLTVGGSNFPKQTPSKFRTV